MAKAVASFEEFCKMGTHPLVKKHYNKVVKDESGVANLHDQNAKSPGVKGNGDAEHTETAEGKSLSDPSIQPKKI